jgi:TRAP-type C4-dicarboxylate transport system permease small subunit
MSDHSTGSLYSDMAQRLTPNRRPEIAQGSGDDESGENLFTIRLDWQRWWIIIPEIVALICAGALPVIVAANVLARYTDWYRISWAEDVVKVLFLWIVFLGGAIAVKYGAHVRMTMLSDRVAPSRLGAAWHRIILLSPIMAGVLLLVLGMQLVEISMRRELPSLEISVGYFMTIVPISGALMIFYAARDFWISQRRSRSEEAAS